MDGDTFLIFLLVLFGLWIYFLPTLIAKARQHKQLAALFALNLLFGWTFLGWGVAFVWAFYRHASAD